jgi:hypothetical protein
MSNSFLNFILSLALWLGLVAIVVLILVGFLAKRRDD